METYTIPRGTRFTFGVNFKRNGVLTSLEGAIVRFTMKALEYDQNPTDSDADIKKDITDGNAEGYAQITILPADTRLKTVKTYHYDVFVDQFGDGLHVYKIEEGKIKLDGSPTNRTV